MALVDGELQNFRPRWFEFRLGIGWFHLQHWHHAPFRRANPSPANFLLHIELLLERLAMYTALGRMWRGMAWFLSLFRLEGD